ncbi:MAG: hypothetical protein GXX82_12885 [Syntrophorhabdus sp.]|jgi:competence protein ComEA|nr:hypothetical protein [Syntrophorhabdus sp.]
MKKEMGRRYLRYYSIFIVAGLAGFLLVIGGVPCYGQAQKTSVDLNTASAKELETLKGVGPATAKKIIAGRPYSSVEDLKKAGISDKLIESMKPHVKVGSAPAPTKGPVPPASAGKPPGKAPAKAAPARPGQSQKVNINTASREQLEALPGIGPVKAQAIIDGRPYKQIEDIMKVKGIKGGTFEKIKGGISIN